MASRVEASAEEDPRAVELWTAASVGEGTDELARLARYVGEEGLTSNAEVPSRRRVALRALAFTDLTALPFLAHVASLASDADATDAMDSILTLLDAPRRATDPEEALELRWGTDALMALAKDKTRSPARRTLAIDALRRLADRRLIPAAEVPDDLDSR